MRSRTSSRLEWWLEHRDKNPELFSDELAAADARVLRGPHRPAVYARVEVVQVLDHLLRARAEIR